MTTQRMSERESEREREREREEVDAGDGHLNVKDLHLRDDTDPEDGFDTLLHSDKTDLPLK